MGYSGLFCAKIAFLHDRGSSGIITPKAHQHFKKEENNFKNFIY
jgi:hypothetical protein